MRTKSAITAFALGIPVWVATSFLLDLLNRATMGMTGAGGQSGNIPLTLTSTPSLFILGYFGFSILAVLIFPNTKRKLLLAVGVHLLLVASIFSGLSEHIRTGKAIGRILILLLVYTVFFSPWLASWVTFVRTGIVQDSFASKIPDQNTAKPEDGKLPANRNESTSERRSTPLFKSKY